MLLKFANGASFATGATTYEYRPATDRETTPRVIVSIKIDQIKTLAFIDTGGVYAICSPEIANDLDLDPNEGQPVNPLNWRGKHINGLLYRIPMTILAEEGHSIEIEPTFFVPQSQDWDDALPPCVLGMYLCLERLRFAIDPALEIFYFGEI